MNRFRLHATVHGASEQEVVSIDVAYGCATNLGRLADALVFLGLSASIYPFNSDENPTVSPRAVGAIRTLLFGLKGYEARLRHELEVEEADELAVVIDDALRQLEHREREYEAREGKRS